ncbi:MAG: hypothetical protein Q7S43_03465 [bacterium]|nr:hypothetical protein [bacterium]
MPLTKIELAQLLERAVGKGEPLTKREFERLDTNLIKKRQSGGLENNKEKIVLTGLILYDLRSDHSDPKNADKRNRYIQRAWDNLCKNSV